MKIDIEKIEWKTNVPTKGIKPDVAYNALEKIRLKNGGLTDDLILKNAQAKNHELHDWFEWDDTVAATEHRRAQARLLLRAFHVVYKEKPELKMRAYEVMHKTRPSALQRTVYSTTEEVLSNPESRDRLIAEAIKMAMQFRNRFRNLHELEKIIEAIDAVIVDIGSA